MRDRPGGQDLLRLAREVLVEELIPLLPPERRLGARLVAAAMGIALRESEEDWSAAIAAEVARLYGLEAPAGPHDGEELLRRFAGDLRKGAFAGSRESAAKRVLWRLTLSKLKEGNPNFLAANDFEV